MAASTVGPSSLPAAVELSQYASNLSTNEFARYVQKVSVIGIDPYLVPNTEKSRDLSQLPELNSMDITAYLISTASPYTANNFQHTKHGCLQSICKWLVA